MTFVDETGKTASPGKHTKKRHLGQGNRSISIVDEDYVIGGKGQFVPTPAAFPPIAAI